MIISSEDLETLQEKLDAHQASQYSRKSFNQDQFEKTICSILNDTNKLEPVEAKLSESTSTQDSSKEESTVEMPSPIVEAFTISMLEVLKKYMTEAIPEDSKGYVQLKGYFSA